MKKRFFPLVKVDYRAGEEHHRRAERQQWEHQNEINRRSNRITKIGSYAAVAAAIGAFVAAVFAGGAYFEAKSQAGADWIAANQAKRQADYAQEVMITAQRPFIRFSTVEMKINKTLGMTSIAPIFISSGVTAPVNTIIKVNYYISNAPMPDNYSFQDLRDVQTHNIDMLPTDKAILTPIPIPLALANSVNLGTVFVYVYGNIRYGDAFGVQHKTEFCGQWVVFNPPNADFVQCPQHNCADDECSN